MTRKRGGHISHVSKSSECGVLCDLVRRWIANEQEISLGRTKLFRHRQVENPSQAEIATVEKGHDRGGRWLPFVKLNERDFAMNGVNEGQYLLSTAQNVQLPSLNIQFE